MTTRRFAVQALIFVAVIALMTAIAIWFNLGPTVVAQSLVRVEPWDGDARVQLAPLDTSAAAQFAHHFQSANGQVSRRFALSLTNDTDLTIAAITLRWTLTAGNQPCVIIHRIQSDAVGGLRGGYSRRPLEAGGARLLGDSATGMLKGILPGERVLVTPGSYYDSRGGGGGWYDELFDASAASVRIDVVIFENGLVMGQDESGTVDAIQAREAAIVEFLGAIKAADDSGQDPMMLIRAAARPRPGSPMSPEHITRMMLANELLRSQDLGGQIAAWRARRLPDFYR